MTTSVEGIISADLQGIPSREEVDSVVVIMNNKSTTLVMLLY